MIGVLQCKFRELQASRVERDESANKGKQPTLEFFQIKRGSRIG